jgi:hypothetical protein
METGREVDEIRMNLVGGGIPVPENLIDLDQSSVDMPPPPMMAPLKRLENIERKRPSSYQLRSVQ